MMPSGRTIILCLAVASPISKMKTVTTGIFPNKLQLSHIKLQSKLQRQIAEGGIGSRKGKGPTKWEGPPAATTAARHNPPRNHANAEDITRNRTS